MALDQSVSPIMRSMKVGDTAERYWASALSISIHNPSSPRGGGLRSISTWMSPTSEASAAWMVIPRKRLVFAVRLQPGKVSAMRAENSWIFGRYRFSWWFCSAHWWNISNASEGLYPGQPGLSSAWLVSPDHASTPRPHRCHAPRASCVSASCQRADKVCGRIIETPATTLSGIVAKIEWGEGDPEITEAVIADLRRWL